MKNIKKVLVTLIIALVIGFIYYYFTLPAINIHAKGFWSFLIISLIILTTILGIISSSQERGKFQGGFIFQNKSAMIGLSITGLVIVIFIIGYILSSPIVNASKYQNLLTIEESDFVNDIEQISYKEIPVLDKESAIRLGSRKMGSIVKYVSQFEVAENYTQINYN